MGRSTDEALFGGPSDGRCNAPRWILDTELSERLNCLSPICSLFSVGTCFIELATYSARVVLCFFFPLGLAHSLPEGAVRPCESVEDTLGYNIIGLKTNTYLIDKLSWKLHVL